MFLPRKTSLALLILSSGMGYAGSMGVVCTPGQVTAPCETTAWDFGAQALYLKPVYDSAWGYIGSAPGSNGQPWFQELKVNWKWGFLLEGSYHMGTGNDINVNWSHFEHDYQPNYYDVGNNYNSITPRWDAVNVEIGQLVNVSELYSLRFHAGAQYAHIQHQYEWVVNGLYDGYTNIRFMGLGPRTGVDMAYEVLSGLSLTGNAAAAVIVGQSHFNDVYEINPAAQRGQKLATVPELEAKLGAKYTQPFGSGNLTVNIGYMWLNYFNAQHVKNWSPYNDTDFALEGPYVGLNWKGTV